MAAHRYWRLRIHSTHSADVWCGVATLTGWAAGLDGDQLLSSLGVVCTATTTWGGFPSTNANDNNNATSWLTGTFADPTDLKFDLGVGVAKDIRQIQFTGRNDPAFYLHYPKNIEWQWSDDDITYTSTIGPLNTPAPTGPLLFYTSPSVGPATAERLTTADVLVAAPIGLTPGIRLTAADILSVINFPSPATRVTAADGLITVKSSTPVRTSFAEVLVAVRGRVANPKVRAWTYTLDGHDYYVLRLGMMLTLVFDVASEQWMDWDAFSEIYWPVNNGMNWVGGTGLLKLSDGSNYGSNVLVGDDTYGLLWFLNPLQPYDDSPEVPDPNPYRYFPRATMGQMPMTGREVLPCYAAWLTTDMGAPAYVGAGVNLSISDDAGATFNDMGTITITPGNNSPELFWGSLGQIQAPGRLFLIVDDGAVARIDGMEMNDPDDKK